MTGRNDCDVGTFNEDVSRRFQFRRNLQPRYRTLDDRLTNVWYYLETAEPSPLSQRSLTCLIGRARLRDALHGGRRIANDMKTPSIKTRNPRCRITLHSNADV